MVIAPVEPSTRMNMPVLMIFVACPVPTTAGTGSEVARGAIVIVDDGRKLGFHSWHLVPKTAICDPELTLGLPARLTAATGMDALTHAVEAYIGRWATDYTDGMALSAVAPSMKPRPRASPNAQMLSMVRWKPNIE